MVGSTILIALAVCMARLTFQPFRECVPYRNWNWVDIYMVCGKKRGLTKRLGRVCYNFRTSRKIRQVQIQRFESDHLFVLSL